ncbi:carboxymuconolactone decarboxylase family protein [Pseudomonas typographi]|uniref:carboxymuconolactone decarboxylase family protein n=1 Tax=Pseudomonas typographi TaxID=2715964 RepID=UPI0016854F1F|nr:carboxymuconolactone decarboxylase family protein [Pseudomonas typographi]MBD1587909.1 carboxymuconolactone decarboxylase family protein [Pseudomonas typographi]
MCEIDEAVTVEDVHQYVRAQLGGVEEGDGLSARTRALINLAVHVSPATLAMKGSEHFMRMALAEGSTVEQVHEVLLLVSGLGVHTLMAGTTLMGRLLRQWGDPMMSSALDARKLALVQKYVGDDPYWDTVEQAFPGFIDSLLRLSSEGFEAFFVYCAVPWKGGALRGLTKELISVAVDATPSHRFMPGIRLHVSNALKLGAGRKALLQALEIAANSPVHPGVH